MENLFENDILIQLVTFTQYSGICALFIFLIIGTCMKKYLRERALWIHNMRKVQSYKQLHKSSEDFEDFEPV